MRQPANSVKSHLGRYYAGPRCKREDTHVVRLRPGRHKPVVNLSQGWVGQDASVQTRRTAERALATRQSGRTSLNACGQDASAGGDALITRWDLTGCTCTRRSSPELFTGISARSACTLKNMTLSARIHPGRCINHIEGRPRRPIQRQEWLQLNTTPDDTRLTTPTHGT
jgi:hypothetical protein